MSFAALDLGTEDNADEDWPLLPLPDSASAPIESFVKVCTCFRPSQRGCSVANATRLIFSV